MDVRVSILHVRGCPLVAGLRAEVKETLERIGATAVINYREGAYLSPTLLIDGVNVDGYAVGIDPACRIHLPTQEQIVSAIVATRRTRRTPTRERRK